MSEFPETRAAAAGSILARLIALAALIVSALGVWIAWKSSSQDKPTEVVEQRSAVPLALRGTVDSDGRTLTIVPADPSHALQSLKVTHQGRIADRGRQRRTPLRQRRRSRAARAARRKQGRHPQRAGADRRALRRSRRRPPRRRQLTSCATNGRAAACSAAARSAWSDSRASKRLDRRRWMCGSAVHVAA